jgi:GAF domain-containing protein
MGAEIMINPRSFLFTVRYPYNNPIDRQRANGLLILNLIIFVLSCAGIVNLVLDGFTLAETPFGLLLTILTFAAPVISIITHFWVHNGRLGGAIWLFVLFLTVMIGSANTRSFYGGNVLLVAIPLAAAASLMGRRGLLLIAGLLTMFIVLGALVQSRLPVSFSVIPAESWRGDFSLIALSLLVSTFFLYTFNGLTQRLARESLRELGFIRQIAQFAANLNVQDEESVYVETIRFIRTQLGYPFAQVFYVDPNGKINRRLRVGLGVRTTSEQPTDVTVGDSSAVSQAASTGQTVIVSQEDAALRWSHFLPSTTQGIALPILKDNTLLGVLDVQSEQEERFSDDQITALKTLTDSIASVAMQYRLVEALRQNIRQQEEVTTTLRARLQELRQGLTTASGGWDNYLQQRGEEVFGFDIEGKAGDSQRVFIAAHDLPHTLRAVLETGALQVTTEGDVKVINVPILLRGEILGAMSFTIPKDRVLSERQIDTAQIVANRLALALENKRLLEQTQAQAMRERRANEATNLLISATNVEAVMNVAAASFNEALGAINTSIHLQPSVINEPERKEMAVS